MQDIAEQQEPICPACGSTNWTTTDESTYDCGEETDPYPTTYVRTQFLCRTCGHGWVLDSGDDE